MPELDKKEFEIPKTTYSHDIESKVLQTIILQCLHQIEGVHLAGGTLIETLFGRDVERLKVIYVEQDSRNHTLNVRLEVNIRYGEPLPQKCAQIQNIIVKEMTRLTGLHVASVHVIVKGLLFDEEKREKVVEEYPTARFPKEKAESYAL